MQTTDYRTTLVDWVNENTNWTHFITLTTRFAMPVQSLVKEVERFIRRLTASTQGPVYHFWVIELTTSGHPHVHLVAQLGKALTAQHIATKWTAGTSRFTKAGLGRVDIQNYNTALNGVWYLSKTLPSESSQWGFHLPRPGIVKP
jgi:hypothetical protein